MSDQGLIQEFIIRLCASLQETSTGNRRKKVKSILRECGLSRQSSSFIDEINQQLSTEQILSDPIKKDRTYLSTI